MTNTPSPLPLPNITAIEPYKVELRMTSNHNNLNTKPHADPPTSKKEEAKKLKKKTGSSEDNMSLMQLYKRDKKKAKRAKKAAARMRAEEKVISEALERGEEEVVVNGVSVGDVPVVDVGDDDVRPNEEGALGSINKSSGATLDEAPLERRHSDEPTPFSDASILLKKSASFTRSNSDDRSRPMKKRRISDPVAIEFSSSAPMIDGVASTTMDAATVEGAELKGGARDGIVENKGPHGDLLANLFSSDSAAVKDTSNVTKGDNIEGEDVELQVEGPACPAVKSAGNGTSAESADDNSSSVPAKSPAKNDEMDVEENAKDDVDDGSVDSSCLEESVSSNGDKERDEKESAKADNDSGSASNPEEKPAGTDLGVKAIDTVNDDSASSPSELGNDKESMDVDAKATTTKASNNSTTDNPVAEPVHPTSTFSQEVAMTTAMTGEVTADIPVVEESAEVDEAEKSENNITSSLSVDGAIKDATSPAAEVEKKADSSSVGRSHSPDEDASVNDADALDSEVEETAAVDVTSIPMETEACMNDESIAENADANASDSPVVKSVDENDGTNEDKDISTSPAAKTIPASTLDLLKGYGSDSSSSSLEDAADNDISAFKSRGGKPENDITTSSLAMSAANEAKVVAETASRDDPLGPKGDDVESASSSIVESASNHELDVAGVLLGLTKK